MCRDRRRADVERQSERLVVKARPYGDDPRCVVDRDRDLPSTLAQHHLQLLQHAQVALQVGQLPFPRERSLEPLQVARRVLHVGFRHLDVMQLDERIELDVPRLGGLAHDLAVNLAARRHIDHDVRFDAGLAREPAPRRERLPARITLLGFRQRRKTVGGGPYAVLCELALRHENLSATADGAAAADGVDVDAQCPRRGEQRRADRKPSALAGRREYDERIGTAHEASLRPA